MSSDMIMYECLRGSHAQGVATPTSDRDFFFIVIPRIEVIVGLEEERGGQTIVNGHDIRTITLKEFLRQCLHGRSTELECLFARSEHINSKTVYAEELINNRQKLISQRLYPSLMGFYKAQKYRMFRGNAGRVDKKLGFDPKMGAHCIRAIWQLINLKKTGNLDIYIGDQTAKNDIINIKAGRVNLSDLTQLCQWYEDRLTTVQDDLIPPEPDYKWANEFLMDVYYDYCKNIGMFDSRRFARMFLDTSANKLRIS